MVSAYRVFHAVALMSTSVLCLQRWDPRESLIQAAVLLWWGRHVQATAISGNSLACGATRAQTAPLEAWYIIGLLIT
jgi:hypothetical protein